MIMYKFFTKNGGADRLRSIFCRIGTIYGYYGDILAAADIFYAIDRVYFCQIGTINGDIGNFCQIAIR